MDNLEKLIKFIETTIEMHEECRNKATDRDVYCFEDGIVMGAEMILAEIEGFE